MIYRPPFPPFPPYGPKLPIPLPKRAGDLIKVAGAAAILGYGAWKKWKERKARQEAEKAAKEQQHAGNDATSTRLGPIAIWPAIPTPRWSRKSLRRLQEMPSSIFDEPYPFGHMESDSRENISLKSVSIFGEVEGLLFSSSIRQEYRNDTDKALEIIYTFPLGWDTALLGLQATIGEKHLTGEVVKTAEAEEKYEKAVKDGDSAIMVQQSSRGLYTANLGNIKAGETVVVEIHCARLLRFEQGQVRLCIPTVIGERYGDPYCDGGLAPHDSARVDASAHYPFTLELTVKGDMAKSAVSCPSHPAVMKPLEDGLCVSLEDGAALDRDFILLMRDVSGSSHALCVPDEDMSMVAASFAPEIPQANVSPLGVKILVDCSGSMSGSSIEEAQKGLGKVLTLLAPHDQVSYSRFGSEVKHLTNSLMPCTPENIEKLSQAIDATSADMGGTEMKGALRSTFQDIAGDAKKEVPPVVLLITDGDVWDVKNIIATAKASGHRIFAIGVGYAPAESLLRDMAEQTGGACEFVSPKENMADAIVRMFHRMRGSIARNIRIEWGQEPVWQSSLPRYIHDGETVHAFALLKGQSSSAPELSWDVDGTQQRAVCQRFETTDSEDLLRLGRRRQMEEAASDEEKLALALKYQLVSDLTSLILVYERPEDDKLEGLPNIQQVPQMQAHGHGCGGRVLMADEFDCLMGPSSMCVASRHMADLKFAKAPRGLVARKNKISSLEYFTKMMSLDELGPGVFSTRHELLEYVLLHWHRNVLSLTSMKEFMDRLFATEKGEALSFYFERLDDNSILEPEQNMAVFLQWAFTKLNPGQPLDRHSMRLITATMKDGDETMAEMVPDFLDAWYANS